MTDIPENQLTDAIINSAIEVHRTLGPGLKEEVYEAALAVELGMRGIACRRQVPVKVVYKGVDIGDFDHPNQDSFSVPLCLETLRVLTPQAYV